MKKTINFIQKVVEKSIENELMLVSNALTYKLLLALFPFIIFIMTTVGFFNINISGYILEISKTLPKEIADLLMEFLQEVVQTKRISLLSISFIITIYSASTGFNSIIDGLNRAYGIEEKSSFFKRKLSSILLVFIFAVLVIFALLFFIFSDYIGIAIVKYTTLEFIPYFLDSLAVNISLFFILLVMIIVIYKVAIVKKVGVYEILPGAILTVISWLILSIIFNIYINNFSRYSKIYGSIGSIFVLVIWINMISAVLLIGGQINAILEKNKKS